MRHSSYKTVSQFLNIQPSTTPPTTKIVDSKLSLPSKNHFVIDMNSKNPFEPSVWGPAFWFTLHNGSVKYPVNASSIVAEKMKGFILGMPYLIPCEKCAEHAKAHIEKNYSRLDVICSGREELFGFFVDFHNYVNKRYGKPIMSIQEAWKLYSR